MHKPSPTISYTKDRSTTTKPPYKKYNHHHSSKKESSSPEDSSPIDSNGYYLYNQDFNHYVVHCQKKPYDVYIGRKNPLIESTVSTKWGNPFKVGTHGNRNQCMKLYRDWIFHKDQNDLFNLAKKELKGKILACWCSPLNCHGMILSEIANSSITNQGYDPTLKVTQSTPTSTSTPTPTSTTTTTITTNTTSASSTNAPSTSLHTTKPTVSPLNTPPPSSSSSSSWANQISNSITSTTTTTTTNTSSKSTTTLKPKSPPSLDSEVDFPSLWNQSSSSKAMKKKM